MKASICQKLRNAKRRIQRRLKLKQWPDRPQPMFSARNIRYEIADRAEGVACGGIGAMHLLARRVGLIDAIDRHLHLPKGSRRMKENQPERTSLNPKRFEPGESPAPFYPARRALNAMKVRLF